MTYAGDLTPEQAYHVLLEQPQSTLVDVRTMAEWTWVGVPDVEGTRFVEWNTWPGGVQNDRFVEEASSGLDQSEPILCLCRSGGRSAAAAAALTAAGFTEVFNISDGFEGNLDPAGHRTGGWRGAGLPWRQS